MFSEAYVILSTGGRESPLWTESPPWTETPVPRQRPPDRDTPDKDTPPTETPHLDREPPPPDRDPLDRDTPWVLTSGGTHPTGMHTCENLRIPELQLDHPIGCCLIEHMSIIIPIVPIILFYKNPKIILVNVVAENQ